MTPERYSFCDAFVNVWCIDRYDIYTDDNCVYTLTDRTEVYKVLRGANDDTQVELWSENGKIIASIFDCGVYSDSFERYEPVVPSER